MEDTETPRMCKYGGSKRIQIMMETVPHVTSGSGLRKFQADGFLFDTVYYYSSDSQHMAPCTSLFAPPHHQLQTTIHIVPLQ